MEPKIESFKEIVNSFIISFEHYSDTTTASNSKIPQYLFDYDQQMARKAILQALIRLEKFLNHKEVKFVFEKLSEIDLKIILCSILYAERKSEVGWEWHAAKRETLERRIHEDSDRLKWGNLITEPNLSFISHIISLHKIATYLPDEKCCNTCIDQGKENNSGIPDEKCCNKHIDQGEDNTAGRFSEWLYNIMNSNKILIYNDINNKYLRILLGIVAACCYDSPNEHQDKHQIERGIFIIKSWEICNEIKKENRLENFIILYDLPLCKIEILKGGARNFYNDEINFKGFIDFLTVELNKNLQNKFNPDESYFITFQYDQARNYAQENESDQLIHDLKVKENGSEDSWNLDQSYELKNVSIIPTNGIFGETQKEVSVYEFRFKREVAFNLLFDFSPIHKINLQKDFTWPQAIEYLLEKADHKTVWQNFFPQPRYFPLPLFDAICHMASKYDHQENFYQIKVQYRGMLDPEFPTAKTFYLPIIPEKSVIKDIDRIKALYVNAISAHIVNTGVLAGFESVRVWSETKLLQTDGESLEAYTKRKNAGEDLAQKVYQMIYENKKNGFEIMVHNYIEPYIRSVDVVVTNDVEDLYSKQYVKKIFSDPRVLSKKIREEKVEPYSIGIDIGATSIKCQLFDLETLFKKDNKGLKEVRRSTIKKPEDKTQKYNSLQEFMEVLFECCQRLIDEAIQDKKLKKRFPLGWEQIKFIGITWPGAVRNGKIAGTSGIFKNFNDEIASMWMRKMTVDKLRKLNPTEEMKVVLKEKLFEKNHYAELKKIRNLHNFKNDSEMETYLEEISAEISMLELIRDRILSSLILSFKNSNDLAAKIINEHKAKILRHIEHYYDMKSKEYTISDKGFESLIKKYPKVGSASREIKKYFKKIKDRSRVFPDREKYSEKIKNEISKLNYIIDNLKKLKISSNKLDELKNCIDTSSFEEIIRTFQNEIQTDLNKYFLKYYENFFPEVGFVNDGTAEGLARITFGQSEFRKHRWSVFKLGTGTAGMIIEKGQLRNGLIEYGKLTNNIYVGKEGAPSINDDNKSTTGVNEEASSKLLVNIFNNKISLIDEKNDKGVLIKNSLPHDFDLDSYDIGRIAAFFLSLNLEDLKDEISIGNLATDLGIFYVHKQKIATHYSIEELRKLILNGMYKVKLEAHITGILENTSNGQSVLSKQPLDFLRADKENLKVITDRICQTLKLEAKLENLEDIEQWIKASPGLNREFINLILRIFLLRRILNEDGDSYPIGCESEIDKLNNLLSELQIKNSRINNYEDIKNFILQNINIKIREKICVHEYNKDKADYTGKQSEILSLIGRTDDRTAYFLCLQSGLWRLKEIIRVLMKKDVKEPLKIGHVKEYLNKKENNKFNNALSLRKKFTEILELSGKQMAEVIMLIRGYYQNDGIIFTGGVLANTLSNSKLFKETEEHLRQRYHIKLATFKDYEEDKNNGLVGKHAYTSIYTNLDKTKKWEFGWEPNTKDVGEKGGIIMGAMKKYLKDIDKEYNVNLLSPDITPSNAKKLDMRISSSLIKNYYEPHQFIQSDYMGVIIIALVKNDNEVCLFKRADGYYKEGEWLYLTGKLERKDFGNETDSKKRIDSTLDKSDIEKATTRIVQEKLDIKVDEKVIVNDNVAFRKYNENERSSGFAFFLVKVVYNEELKNDSLSESLTDSKFLNFSNWENFKSEYNSLTKSRVLFDQQNSIGFNLMSDWVFSGFI